MIMKMGKRINRISNVISIASFVCQDRLELTRNRVWPKTAMDSEIPFSHWSLTVAVALPSEWAEEAQEVGAVVGAIDLYQVMRVVWLLHVHFTVFNASSSQMQQNGTAIPSSPQFWIHDFKCLCPVQAYALSPVIVSRPSLLFHPSEMYPNDSACLFP